MEVTRFYGRGHMAYLDFIFTALSLTATACPLKLFEKPTA